TLIILFFLVRPTRGSTLFPTRRSSDLGRRIGCGGRMAKKIALEEHFLCPGFVDYWNPTAADLPAAKREQALARLSDFGEIRLTRSEEHTSELQSPCNLVCRLLLEK